MHQLNLTKIIEINSNLGEKEPHLDSKLKVCSRAVELGFESWKKLDSLILACCLLD